MNYALRTFERTAFNFQSPMTISVNNILRTLITMIMGHALAQKSMKGFIIVQNGILPSSEILFLLQFILPMLDDFNESAHERFYHLTEPIYRLSV